MLYYVYLGLYFLHLGLTKTKVIKPRSKTFCDSGYNVIMDMKEDHFWRPCIQFISTVGENIISTTKIRNNYGVIH